MRTASKKKAYRSIYVDFMGNFFAFFIFFWLLTHFALVALHSYMSQYPLIEKITEFLLEFGLVKSTVIAFLAISHALKLLFITRKELVKSLIAVDETDDEPTN